MRKRKWLTAVGFAGMCCLWIALTLTASSDMNQDLGRHLKIGNIILRDLRIPATNLFSYTHPNYPFINHHWLSEILFYLLHQMGGVPLLIVLKSLAIVAACAVAWRTARQMSSGISAMTAAAIVAPFLLERSDIRPEIAGYIAFSLLLGLLYTIRKDDRRIWIVPVILLFWVNMHISFVFGILLAGLIGIRMIRIGYQTNKLVVWVVASSVALLLNPHGVTGVIYPFLIYREYGYTIAENQNMVFLSGVIHDPLIGYIAILSPLLAAAFGILLVHRRYMPAFILCLFTGLAVWQVRHLPFFMLGTMTPLAMAVESLSSLAWVRRYRMYLGSAVFGIVIIASLAGFLSIYQRRFDMRQTFGLDVHEDGKAGANFMLSHQLPGPIFNNFDIGGYAIYRLYPTYRVFVDNRPEAYPSQFFTDTYIPLQEDEKKQTAVFERYGIRTIFFAHTDQTPWAQTFVTRIMKDKRWRLVYLDKSVFIMTVDQSQPDIRHNTAYLSSLVDSRTDYLGLLQLTNILSELDPTLAMKAFGEATLQNPGSCVIVRNRYQQRMVNPVLGSAEEIRRDNRICF